MSQGIFIKGFPTANVNGTYTINNPSAIGTKRSWDSVDNLYRLQYRDLPPIYRLTEDTVFDPYKSYYTVLVDEETGEITYVKDTETHGRADEIPSNTYYELVEQYQWEIVSIQTINYSELQYKTILEDNTIDPYNHGIVWEDANGSEITTASVEYWDESSFSTTISDPVVDEEAGTTTTVTKTTNLVTGDVYTETNVVRTKNVYVQKQLVRYDNMNLTIGRVYRFQFVSDFEQLGYRPTVEDQPLNSGIYRLDKVLQYLELATSGIDLYANLYQPLAISKDVYNSDLNNLADDIVYKLVDPTDESVVYYMPQSFIKDSDPSVEKYNKLLLTIDLGIQSDPDKFSEIQSIMEQMFEKMWGITPQGDNPLATVAIYDHIWLTTTQMEQIEKAREEVKKDSTVDLINLFDLENTNYIFVENRRLKGQVANLEEALQTINNKN